MQRRPILIQDYGPDPLWVGLVVGLGVLALGLLVWAVVVLRKKRAQHRHHITTLERLSQEREALQQDLWRWQAEARHQEEAKLTTQLHLEGAQRQLAHLTRQLGQAQAEHGHLQQQHHQAQDALLETRLSLQTQRQLLLQADRVNSLGMLVATVLHELNSPLGAIKGTVQLLAQQIPPLLQRLPGWLTQLPPDVQAGFVHLLSLADELPAEVEGRNIEVQRTPLANALRTAQILDAEELAARLARLGLTSLPPTLEALVRHGEALELVQAALVLRKLGRNLETIDASVGRTQRTLAQLRNYASPVEAPAQQVHLAETLDQVLNLYRQHLQPGIHVERAYQPLPPIVAYPDRLMQVWTNLLLNAVQAIRGGTPTMSGCIWIEVQAEPGAALVRFRDDGPGIPPELLPRIFDPFVSTKAGAGGMGLGLHIAQQIIVDHGGRIEVRSQPGRTVFDIRLPMSGSATSATIPHPHQLLSQG